jgi:hypothetical protein
MSNPVYDRTSMGLNWFSVIMWWPLPVALWWKKPVELTNYVLAKLVELVILMQFIVVPLTYETMTNKFCDPTAMQKLGINENECSKMTSSDYKKSWV